MSPFFDMILTTQPYFGPSQDPRSEETSMLAPILCVQVPSLTCLAACCGIMFIAYIAIFSIPSSKLASLLCSILYPCFLKMAVIDFRLPSRATSLGQYASTPPVFLPTTCHHHLLSSFRAQPIQLYFQLCGLVCLKALGVRLGKSDPLNIYAYPFARPHSNHASSIASKSPASSSLMGQSWVISLSATNHGLGSLCKSLNIKGNIGEPISTIRLYAGCSVTSSIADEFILSLTHSLVSVEKRLDNALSAFSDACTILPKSIKDVS